MPYNRSGETNPLSAFLFWREDVSIKQEYDAMLARKAEVVSRLQKVEFEVSDLNKNAIIEMMGKKKYLEWRKGKIREKLAIVSELQEIKLWLKTNQVMYDKECLAIKRTSFLGEKTLDVYDLGNALIEPQTLLQRAYVRLKRCFNQLGKQDGDQALMEVIHSYLIKHGICID